MDNVKKLIGIKENFNQNEEKKLEGQHMLKKLGARERINILLDEDSFIEIGAFIKESCVITGYGTIDGKLVYVYSQDYTRSGALMNSNSAEKIVDIIELALKMGAPIIQILDSAGVVIEEGLEILKKYSKINNIIAKTSGVIPQISLILGPCLGMSAVTASMSDFTIISKDTGSMTLNSYEFLSNKEGTFIEKSELGSSSKSSNIGGASIVMDNDEQCIEITKKIVGYIPSNNMCKNVKKEHSNKEFIQEILDEMCNKNNLNLNLIINHVLDDDSRLELYAEMSHNVSTVLGKINGITVGIFCTSKECLNINDINKLTRFIKLCDAYHIPIISMVNTDGFEVSLDSEKEGLYFSIAKLTFAISESTTPKIALIVGKSYGSSYMTFSGKQGGFDIVYAWPSAQICLSNPENIIKKMKRSEILQSEKPKQKEREIISKLIHDMVSPYKAAEIGLIDDIIIPRETRARLYMLIDMLQTKKEVKYTKSHGTMLI